MTNDSWGQVRDGLIKTIGKNNFVTWIEPLRLIDLKDGIARFEAPTKFMRDWVMRNFAEKIRTHLVLAGQDVDRVEL
ncbi:MAG: chromosomal replication initiator protein DnaA, partial [Rhodobacteraceae bacterium]|nr:chromosomal replication initiator protein DnaA [Paracoccaceae bacterium]MCB2159867.1 chromosomal replication initiator protein DnaA [Paracoccaceae bacterium]